MKKFVGYFIIFFSTLFLLFLSTILIVTKTIDPNKYKHLLIGLIESKTGRNTTIDGDIKLNYFPWLGFDIKNITISNAEGFSPEIMLHIEELSASIKILPLLFKEIEISSIKIKDPFFSYAINTNGESNIDDIIKIYSKVNSLHKNYTNTTSGNTNISLSHKQLLFDSTSIEGVMINNATLSYQNHITNQTIVLSALDISTGKILPNKTLNINVSTYLVGESDLIQYDLKINTVMEILFTSATLERADIDVKLLSKLNIPKKNILSDTNINLRANIDLKEKELNVTHLQLIGKAKGGVILDNEIKLSLNANNINLNYDKMLLNAPDIKGSVNDAAIFANITATDLGKKTEVKFNVETNTFSPYSLINSINKNILLEDINVLKSFSLMFHGIYSDKLININNLSAVIDDISIIGSLTTNLKKDKASILTNISIDKINLEKYLPQNLLVKNIPHAVQKTEPVKKNEAIVIPEFSLSKIPNIKANLKISYIGYKDINITDLSIPINLVDGKLNATTVTFKINDASSRSDILLVATDNDFNISITSSLTSMMLDKVYSSLIPKKELPIKIPRIISYNLNANYKNNNLNISKLNLRMDDITLNNKVNIEFKEIPFISFDIGAENINLSNYLTKKQNSEAETQNKVKTPLNIDTYAIPFEYNGTLSVSSIKYDNVTVNNILLNSSLKNKIFKIKNLSGNLYGGKFTVTAQSSGKNKDLKNSIYLKLDSFSIGKLQKEVFHNIDTVFDANIFLEASSSFSGVEIEDISKTTNASIKYELDKIRITSAGYNFLNIITNYSVKKVSEPFSIYGKLTIDSGKLKIPSTKFLITSLDTKGLFQGVIDVYTGKIDATIELDTPRLSIPVTINGTITKPNVSIDKTIILNIMRPDKLIGGRLTENIANGTIGIGEEIGGQIGNLFKSIFD